MPYGVPIPDASAPRKADKRRPCSLGRDMIEVGEMMVHDLGDPSKIAHAQCARERGVVITGETR